MYLGAAAAPGGAALYYQSLAPRRVRRRVPAADERVRCRVRGVDAARDVRRRLRPVLPRRATVAAAALAISTPDGPAGARPRRTRSRKPGPPPASTTPRPWHSRPDARPRRCPTVTVATPRVGNSPSSTGPVQPQRVDRCLQRSATLQPVVPVHLVHVEVRAPHEPEPAQAGQADRDRLRRVPCVQAAASRRKAAVAAPHGRGWRRGHPAHRPFGLVAQVPSPHDRLLPVGAKIGANTVSSRRPRRPASDTVRVTAQPHASRSAPGGTTGSRRARTGHAAGGGRGPRSRWSASAKKRSSRPSGAPSGAKRTPARPSPIRNQRTTWPPRSDSLGHTASRRARRAPDATPPCGRYAFAPKSRP